MSNSPKHQSISAIPRRFGAGVVATALVAVGMPLAATSALAAGINNPPVSPHSIISFPARDLVSASGYDAADRPTVQVVRGGVVVGQSTVVVPVDDGDPLTPFAGIVDVNHPGGGCWVGVTPSIRAGDLIRVLTAPGTGDETRTAGVTITQKATNSAGTVTIKGNAVSATGGQIDITQLESRIINPGFSNGKRTIRADSTGRADGTLAYDGSGTAWTATFAGLSVADVALAVAGESRIFWLGADPLAATEATIYEAGGPTPAAKGPAAPDCTAPSASGPSFNLTFATDSGIPGDSITGDSTPTFAGLIGLPTATTVNLYVDDVLAGTSAVSGGSFSITVTTPLTDGLHTITAGEVGPSLIPTTPASTVETMSGTAASITIDTLAPVAPSVTGTLPAVAGSSSTPSTSGTAETGSTVLLYNTPDCTVAVALGTAAVFASTGIVSTVAAGSTTSFFATATDVAANQSPCSTSSASYRQDSVSPTVTARGPAASAAGVSQAANITATFSENVQAVSGTTMTLKVSTATPVAAVVSYNVTTRVATLNPTATLAAATTYTASLSGGIKDAVGNPLAATSWSFTTGPRPTILSATPAANATGVSQAANMAVRFSENVTGVGPTAFILKTTTGVTVGATVSYNAVTRVATLNPTASLAPATSYIVTLTSSIKDVDGNPITAMSWRFSTGPRPTLIRATPAAGALGVSRLANVSATFSENVSGVSRTSFTLRKASTGALVTVIVSYNATTHVATLNPSVTLAANTMYVVSLSSLISDADGNGLTARRWSFITGR